MKPPRVIHGSVSIGPNRWKKLGLVGGGTGVAPLIQVNPVEDQPYFTYSFGCVPKYTNPHLVLFFFFFF